MLDLQEYVRIAYKKLKSSVYFDKTQLPLRDRITTFESRSGFDKKLKQIVDALSGTKTEWEQYLQSRLQSVGIFVFPKKLKPVKQDMVILNGDNTPIEMEAPQYFIDLDVEGHILGVLWVLLIGIALDSNGEGGMYEHSYGNRLKKNLISENSGEITYSPGLFEPYFSQYENWRDNGLQYAQERLGDKQDALILTLDFKSFFYSVDLRKKDFDEFLKKLEKINSWHKRVNEFVFLVVRTYSEKLRKCYAGTGSSIEHRNVLPIGFLPSNILANWVLTPFDNAIIERWNPTYYGRYVDDVIIVDKVEKNSPLYRRAREKDPNGQLTANEVIQTFLTEFTAKPAGVKSCKRVMLPIKKNGKKCAAKEAEAYRVDPQLLSSAKSKILTQESKVKVFYFQAGATQALLSCFRTQIARNASEFRLMPDLENVLKYKNYSEIFQLHNSDTVNKFRSVEGLNIDKYALSKFLGKYRQVSGMIEEQEERVFERDLMLIMDERALIENYGLWERLFEILIINDRIDLLEKLVLRILSGLEHYVIPSEVVSQDLIHAKEGMLRVLRAALCRVAALVWNHQIADALQRIQEALQESFGTSDDFSGPVMKDFDLNNMSQTRAAYCQTRMINKYVMPLPVDCVLSNLSFADDGEDSVRLYDLFELREHIEPTWSATEQDYIYYPYTLKPEELSFAWLCTALTGGGEEELSLDMVDQAETVSDIFLRRNYPNVDNGERDVFTLSEVCTNRIVNGVASGHFVTEIKNLTRQNKAGKLCVAIGNVELKMSDFKLALDRTPNRGYKRYMQLSKILDEAVDQEVDLLVLPENYLPFEWLPTVIRFCANNQMGLITGIEHIVASKEKGQVGRVVNLTAVILPYMHQQQKFAYVAYHNKTAYAPREKLYITEYGHIYRQGKKYHLFHWRDVWFPAYCCFELASIHDRALFRSCADMVVAVEWNEDIAYFSSIIESLCRDLHCYCIQANSSGPGDSRVLQPTKSEQRDIVKTKGGKHPCILAADIDIQVLRDFQRLGSTLQRDKMFKATPPDYDGEVLRHRRDGTLFQFLTQKASRESF